MNKSGIMFSSLSNFKPKVAVLPKAVPFRNRRMLAVPIAGPFENVKHCYNL